MKSGYEVRTIRERVRSRLGDETGTVSTEYVILLFLVALGCVSVILLLGAPLVLLYQTQITWLSIALI